MKAKAFALLVVAAILLSGCAAKKGGDEDKDGTGTSTTTKTGTATDTGTKSTSGSSSGGPGGLGNITVAFTRSTPNGAVPLAVNFTLNATFKGADGKVAKPASLSWSVKVVSGDATNATSTDGPTGTTLPANFTLNFAQAGNRTIVAQVNAPGYASANATILVAASPGGVAGAPLFFDGAEGDASQWTIASKVLITNVAPMVPEQELAADHPSKYAASTDQAKTGTKSWHVTYDDNLRARMTSVAIPLTAGSHTLSYTLKGGAEGTSIEGLFILVGPADGTLAVVGHHSGAAIDWTTFNIPVPASAGPSIKVQFRFDSDVSCSSGAATVPPEDPAGACGDGFDAGGYFIDDVTVV